MTGRPHGSPHGYATTVKRTFGRFVRHRPSEMIAQARFHRPSESISYRKFSINMRSLFR
jgi:hypothetical protein